MLQNPYICQKSVHFYLFLFIYFFVFYTPAPSAIARTHAHTHTRTPAHTHARTSPRCHVASIYTFHQVRNFHVCPSAQTQASTHFQKVTPCCSFSLVWCLFPPSQNYQRMSYTSFSRLRMSQRTRSASRRSPRTSSRYPSRRSPRTRSASSRRSPRSTRSMR